jgi:hypothetical protein
MTTTTRTRSLCVRDHEARALADGRCSLIVRPVKEQSPGPDYVPKQGVAYPDLWAWTKGDEIEGMPFRCPFGRVGDVLACKEAYCTTRNLRHGWGTPLYRATFGAMLKPICEGYTPWRSAATMPLDFVRTYKTIVGLTIGRPCDLTEEEAKATGIYAWTTPDRPSLVHYGMRKADCWENDPRKALKRIYESTYGAGSWERWAWVMRLGEEGEWR